MSTAGAPRRHVLISLVLCCLLGLAAAAEHQPTRSSKRARHHGAAGHHHHGHHRSREEQERCANARNPIIIVPGIMGSDLDVRFLGSRVLGSRGGPCSIKRPSKLSLWPPFSPDLLRNSACFMYLLQPVPCEAPGGGGLRLCNNAGVSMFVNPGGDAGTDTFAFQQGGYVKLTDYLSSTFGYTLGQDLFAAPYDWRLTLPALEEAGQFEVIASRVEDAVQRNCGRKAILIGHSMGTLVSLGLLHSPKLAAWRSANVMGYLALAPPYGGSTFAVASKLGGTRFNLIDFVSDFIQPIVNELIYHGSRGLPSMLMLMPNRGLWGKDFVLVHTPSRNYTLGDLTDLFRATGDYQSVELFEQAQVLGQLLGKGPVPGVDTHCVYGASMPTVQSWRYKNIVQGRPAPVGSADAAATGLGDGVVNVESMRLCRKLTDSGSIRELGPGVDHGTVLSHPESLAAIKDALTEMLAGADVERPQEYAGRESGGEDDDEEEEAEAADAERDDEERGHAVATAAAAPAAPAAAAAAAAGPRAEQAAAGPLSTPATRQRRRLQALLARLVRHQ